MTNENPQDLIERLDDLLDQERQALIAGDLERIGELMLIKEDLIGKINALEAVEQGRLDTLQEKVTRNQALLTSALDGIRAVANRMADLRRVRAGLETYDRRGQKRIFGTATETSVEKRA
ncbi:flagellar biosynthesis protein FlgN [Sedimentitalea sp. HM32M-2]|uniref:flagellar biosynthesis protein FlgN n=1 Tax=Sedimentitalea sp. HM32M-2 TaxID=3351566 RepID=UPI003644A8CE